MLVVVVGVCALMSLGVLTVAERGDGYAGADAGDAGGGSVAMSMGGGSSYSPYGGACVGSYLLRVGVWVGVVGC